jgi:hypothetical protein
MKALTGPPVAAEQVRRPTYRLGSITVSVLKDKWPGLR